MKSLFILVAFLLFSCTKEQGENQLAQEDTPTFIQIEAVHIDGTVEPSKIILVR